MIDPKAVKEIIGLYTKHGWTLRRVLLADETDAADREMSRQFSDTEIRRSELNALWFTRRSRPGIEAWEIRRLTGTPYALVVNVEDGTPADVLEAALADTESRMAESLQRPMPTVDDVSAPNGNEKNR